MNNEPCLIVGSKFFDHRGTLASVNDFKLDDVKRMYFISHPDPEIKRGWRAHKSEQRWFYVVKGRFEVSVVKIDDFLKPDRGLPIERFHLSELISAVLYVPVGYATAFVAKEQDSMFMTFADSYFEDAAKDDYQYPVDYFLNWGRNT